MQILKLGAFGWVLFIAACGGEDDASSGINGNKKLSQLNMTEVKKLCHWQAEKFGGEGAAYDCNGMSDQVPTADECASLVADSLKECDAKVSEMESCIDTANSVCEVIYVYMTCEPIKKCFTP